MIFGIITISDFVAKYARNLREKEQMKTELITMQAFHQGIAMLIGAVAVGIIWFIFR